MRGPRRDLVTVLAGLLVSISSACDGGTPLQPEFDPSFRKNDAPSGTNVLVVAYNRIDVRWQDNSPNETGFEVQSANAVGGSFAPRGSTGAGVTGFSDGGLSGATQYCYRVRAFRTTGRNTTYSDFSNIACATTPPPPVPAAPSGMNAVPVHSTAISVSWSDNSTDESGFRLEYSLDGGSSWMSIGFDLGANATGFYHGGRTDDQIICYRVTAFNSLGSSAPSNVDCTAPPLTPSQLIGAGSAGPAIDLTWNDNSAVEDGYEVRRVGPVGPAVVVAVLPANSETYHDAGIAADTRYTYSVGARRDGGYSDFTAASAISASAPPPAPATIHALPYNSSSISVSWIEESDKVEGFRVERSADAGASWSTVGTTAWTYPAFYEYGLASEQRLCYRVVAFNSAGESAPSEMACATPPAAPSGLLATAAAGLAIDLSWSDNSNVEEGYEVQQLVTVCDYYYYYYPYCYSYYVMIATLDPDVTTYHVSGLNPGEFYTFVVVARKDGGYSDFSNEAASYPGPEIP